jgi:predicted transposase YbfD/YdcC
MAAITSVASIKKHFRGLKDPRIKGRSSHLLVDVITMSICAVIGNCNDWRDIELFAKERESWFRRFLRLPNGIPSHDTFARVFARLDPRVFSRCCVDWLRAASDLVGLKHIAIDGKTLRGSASSKLAPLHLVSAWAAQAHLSLGQVAVDGKSNEITAIPQLLELLDLKGALVTIDAIGCQKAIAGKIVERGGDYVLAVKSNQERLLSDIQETVGKALDGEFAKHQVAMITTVDEGHGRREERTYTVITNLEKIRDRSAWPSLRVVGMCCRQRLVNGEETMESHYFIGSRKMGARKYAEALRNHWSIENNLHWQLDVSFDEDKSQIQDRTTAENFAVLRKLALMLLKRNPEPLSIARKRMKAALDPDFLAATLTAAANVEKI